MIWDPMTRYLTAGPYRLDVKDERLFKNGAPLKIGGKAFSFLRLLMENPQLLVTKDELIASVWDDRSVSESVLTTAAKELRIALGDDARQPTVIETVHGRGYRFLMDVVVTPDDRVIPSGMEAAGAGIPDPKTEDGNATDWSDGASRRQLAIGLCAVLVAGIGFAFFYGDGPVIETGSGSLQLTSDTNDNSNNTGAADGVPVLKSIAVLPFIDLSEGGDHAWFAEGLSEELIHSLARTPDLRVASRSTSFQYKGNGVDLMEAANEMGVDHVLEGSVRRGDDRVRVTAQLIRARDGFHLWSQNYDRDYEDVIAIQEDIAFEIATALKSIMDPETLRTMLEAGTRSVEAYEALLEGHALSSDVFTPSGQGIRRNTFEMYERARKLDPNFAEAHWLSAKAWEQRFSVFALPPDQAQLTAEEISRSFEERVNAAIASASNSVRAKFYRASLSAYRLQYRDALMLMGDYVAGQPNDLGMQIQRIKLATYVADYKTARDAARTLVMLTDKRAPEFERTIPNLIWSKDFEAARRQALYALEVAPFDSYIRYQSHRALLWAGDRDGARQLIPEIQSSGLPQIIKVLTRLRQACADDDDDSASMLADEARNQTNLSSGIRWIIAMIVGQEEEAYALIESLDRQENLQQLAEFMLYPHFDSSRFPKLSMALRADSIERAKPIPLPYACN